MGTNTAWDRARKRLLKRKSPDGELVSLERGVNYFVESLERLGARTLYSCEGHPDGFYILFEAAYPVALLLQSAGFFSVEIEGVNRWSIRKRYQAASVRDHYRTLRWASKAWEKRISDIGLGA